jgi:hypothetical protein
MRGGADPPTVVDAVVTPDADNTPRRRPACEGDIVWTFTYTIVPTTPPMDLYYTVDMRPSPSVLRRFVHRELSCRCAGGATHQRLSMPAVTLTDQYAAAAGPACEGDIVWTFTYTDCATTRRLDLYYTVDMRPSPSVLRRFVHRELSADAWWRRPTTVVDAVVTPDATNTRGRRPACEGDIVWTFTYTIVPTTPPTGLYLYGGYAAFTISAAPGLSTVNCLPMRWWRDPQRLSMLR